MCIRDRGGEHLLVPTQGPEELRGELVFGLDVVGHGVRVADPGDLEAGLIGQMCIRDSSSIEIMPPRSRSAWALLVPRFMITWCSWPGSNSISGQWGSSLVWISIPLGSPTRSSCTASRITGPRGAGARLSFSVSYTHLDVYKRQAK